MTIFKSFCSQGDQENGILQKLFKHCSGMETMETNVFNNGSNDTCARIIHLVYEISN
jgi:hypothetical protein